MFVYYTRIIQLEENYDSKNKALKQRGNNSCSACKAKFYQMDVSLYIYGSIM
jgi:hypothetical protein